MSFSSRQPSGRDTTVNAADSDDTFNSSGSSINELGLGIHDDNDDDEYEYDDADYDIREAARRSVQAARARLLRPTSPRAPSSNLYEDHDGTLTDTRATSKHSSGYPERLAAALIGRVPPASASPFSSASPFGSGSGGDDQAMYCRAPTPGAIVAAGKPVTQDKDDGAMGRFLPLKGAYLRVAVHRATNLEAAFPRSLHTKITRVTRRMSADGGGMVANVSRSREFGNASLRGRGGRGGGGTTCNTYIRLTLLDGVVGSSAIGGDDDGSGGGNGGGDDGGGSGGSATIARARTHTKYGTSDPTWDQNLVWHGCRPGRQSGVVSEVVVTEGHTVI